MLSRISVFILFLLLTSTVILAQDAQATYRLGQQDEVSVTVLRHPELSQNYTVPPDGSIDFPRAGRVNILGKTTAEVAEALRAKYAEFMVDPTVTVVLIKARQKSAFVLGAVNKPGQYPITDTTRVTEMIAAAGDLVGDLRELTASIKRNEKVIPVELHAALNGTKAEANLQVQEGDLLWIIAPTKITVVVMGQVRNPGPLKLLDACTPVDALAAAGDITDRPERIRITLMRGVTTEKLAWGDNTTRLRDGDVIQVEKEQQARIYVNGKVKNPEAYELPEGGGVLEAIALAGGVLPNAALGQITIIRAKDGSSERIDLAQAFAKGTVTENPKLNAGDQVIVPEWTARISVFGMVSKAGTFEISETTPFTLIDAISMAGVDNKRAKLSHVTVVRVVDNKPQQTVIDVGQILKKGKGDMNITLSPGDIVYVPESEKDIDKLIDNLYKIGILAITAL